MIRWPADLGLQARMGMTLILLGLVYVAFIGALAYTGIDGLFLVLIVAGGLLAQYFFSDQLVLLSMGARLVSDEEEPHLHQVMTRLAAIAGLPTPRIAIADSPVPNAFATGRNQKNAVVAVTRGLLGILTPAELEAVLAHELSHVRNRDVMVITLASLLSTAAFFVLRLFLSAPRHGGRGGRDSLWFIVPLLSGAVWVISFLLIKALSRYREFAADRGSAILTGRPADLVSSLMKISGEMDRVPTTDLREVEGMNAFFIIPALSGDAILELFATHPPVRERIRTLMAIEEEMNRRGP